MNIIKIDEIPSVDVISLNNGDLFRFNQAKNDRSKLYIVSMKLSDEVRCKEFGNDISFSDIFTLDSDCQVIPVEIIEIKYKDKI